VERSLAERHTFTGDQRGRPTSRQCANFVPSSPARVPAAESTRTLARTSRPLRICVPGGVYHVVSRGNNRGAVFRDDIDRARFLEVVAQVVGRFGWLCHAYCLMTTHYHLLVETPRPNLPRGMRQLNGVHAQRFNRRHERCGHVFEARYRAIFVQKETHLGRAARYIVLNPVRAAMVAHPGEWPWSSYRATAGLARRPPWLTTSSVLGWFAGRRVEAQAEYRAFVQAGIEADPPWPSGERLGDEAFLRDTFGHEPPVPEIPRAHVQPRPPPLDELFDGSSPAAISAAYRRHGYTLAQIAEHLGCHYSTVSRRLRAEEAIGDSPGDA
jgi:REP element-mobilizing transposase RayT